MTAIFIISLTLIILRWVGIIVLLIVAINENGYAEGIHVIVFLVVSAKTIALITFISLLYVY